MIAAERRYIAAHSVATILDNNPELPSLPRSPQNLTTESHGYTTKRDAIGALLRREGLYTSLISEWRKQRDRGAGKPAGRPQSDPRDRELSRLRRENERLAAELDRARKVIEVFGTAAGRQADRDDDAPQEEAQPRDP